ncbi:MAG: glycosyltransferase family 9 protein [Endomicrobiales bacterium]
MNTKNLSLKTDCVHFPLDRPCRSQKEEGIRCDACNRYVPVASHEHPDVRKILIVKLGAMGDVLRTTFLLEGLKMKYDKSEITWVVAPQSVPVLEGNERIDRIWPMDTSLLSKLVLERFDVVVNLDLSPESLGLATLASAKTRIGFWLDDHRRVQCSNDHARAWLAMSAFDDEKKKNKETYQYRMSQIAGLPRPDYEIVVPLTAASIEKAGRFRARKGLNGRTVIGINPGAGKRWPLKKWTDKGYLEIIRLCAAAGWKVLLLGGPEEKDLMEKLVEQSGGAAIGTGTENPLPDFFALLGLCDVLLTGDTMALHAALGLKKKAVAVFGPTSAAEIELYGRGIKVVSPAPCACCYRPSCDVKPDCMQLVSPETVWEALKTLVIGCQPRA